MKTLPALSCEEFFAPAQVLILYVCKIVGLRTQEDAVVLDWAATTGRVLLTHDAQTMPARAYGRVQNMLPMPGVFVVPQDEAIGRIIEDLILLAECSREGEWEGQVHYLPLK